MVTSGIDFHPLKMLQSSHFLCVGKICAKCIHIDIEMAEHQVHGDLSRTLFEGKSFSLILTAATLAWGYSLESGRSEIRVRHVRRAGKLKRACVH